MYPEPEANIPPDLVKARAAAIARDQGRSPAKVTASDRARALDELTREVAPSRKSISASRP